jgi:hypothetical protein
MAKENIAQEAKRIEECCNEILNSESPNEIHQQVKDIKACCENIEQNI